MPESYKIIYSVSINKSAVEILYNDTFYSLTEVIDTKATLESSGNIIDAKIYQEVQFE